MLTGRAARLISKFLVRYAAVQLDETMPPLTQTDLNRALLARQMLLARENISPLKAIERLAGMQAQQARPPFVGLWTRLENFQRAELLKLFHRRRIVRATGMRATIHLFTARDYLVLRGALQPMLGAVMSPKFIKELGGVPVRKIAATARKFFSGEARSFKELREWLQPKHPKADYRIAALAVRMNVPLLGVPGDSPWGFSTNATWTLAEEWLGQPVPAQVNTSALIKKYLAAFGPATPADAQAFSGCKGLRAEFEKLRPQLKVFQNEKGQELFDLPRAPRPPANTPAPARFIPEFDNLILAHADRTRIVADEHRPALITKNLHVPATFLINGRVAGTWKIERAKKSATLIIHPFAPLPAKAKAELKYEGEPLLHFIEPDRMSKNVILMRRAQ
jgi:hypothetical protein